MPIPLSLYIHIPWCIKKCPYCDFNSYQQPKQIPENTYIDAVLQDFERDLPYVAGRPIQTIFIGGGTPSLFHGAVFDRLLGVLKQRASFDDRIEITLEANPGTVEQIQFMSFLRAGINRLSIGIQSFQNSQLQHLGRIHSAKAAIQAVRAAQQMGFKNINLDLMFGLPGQTIVSGLKDLKQAIALEPTHISWYQLTLEPNTAFYRHPPALPDESLVEELYFQGLELLEQAGYKQYEISAYAKPGFECRHNRNYWEFGDYLGIGAGAHGKINIHRISKKRQPRVYLQGNLNTFVDTLEALSAKQLPLEFMMNALRLRSGFTWELYETRTGLSRSTILQQLKQAAAMGLLAYDADRIQPTSKGLLFLNSILELFADTV